MLSAGVRQGCPLSPLIYAATADILLRAMAGKCPAATIRAYADDTATVTPDFWHDAPLLRNLFDDFERVSGLGLNIGKCVIIPLSPQPLPNFRERLCSAVPEWGNMQVATFGTYLGFAVGPGKGDATWNKPAVKFTARAHMWSGLPLGLQYDALVYNVFGISVLSYVSQLESPPNWMLQEEEAALRTAASGPGQWAVPDDLWRLRESFGLAKSFKSLRITARSAQLRVWTTDLAKDHGIGFALRAAGLRHLMDAPEYFGGKKHWADWYRRSFLLCLDDNRKQFARGVCTIKHLTTTLQKMQRPRVSSKEKTGEIASRRRTPPHIYGSCGDEGNQPSVDSAKVLTQLVVTP